MRIQLGKLALLLGLSCMSFVAFAGDCVVFNPDTAAVKLESGDWKVVDGSHWMFSFGSKRNEAVRALQIIKKYRMNQSCFVGRPGPSFWYLLSQGGQPPRGNLLSNEDCIAFNPVQVQVQFFPQSNSWKLVQGDMWMEDFGDKRQEAEQALSVIRRYRFNQQCFVGRPQPSFRYWKSTPPFALENEVIEQ